MPVGTTTMSGEEAGRQEDDQLNARDWGAGRTGQPTIEVANTFFIFRVNLGGMDEIEDWARRSMHESE
jgi:hypothetical protein